MRTVSVATQLLLYFQLRRLTVITLLYGDNAAQLYGICLPGFVQIPEKSGKVREFKVQIFKVLKSPEVD